MDKVLSQSFIDNKEGIFIKIICIVTFGKSTTGTQGKEQWSLPQHGAKEP